jgi:hypothetical protein
MAELVNCAVSLRPFHDPAQQHTCKGCGDKIHSSILCPKCPKVVDHEEDNWCSDRYLKKNWSYVEDCPAYVRTHGLDSLVDDEGEEKAEEV